MKMLINLGWKRKQYSTQCKICQKEINIENMGESALKTHAVKGSRYGKLVTLGKKRKLETNCLLYIFFMYNKQFAEKRITQLVLYQNYQV